MLSKKTAKLVASIKSLLTRANKNRNPWYFWMGG